MTRFRPCIDLHRGCVKQIVGGTLTEDEQNLQTNFTSDRSAGWYAELYRRDGLRGGHVIMLGQGNEAVAREALSAWPGGLQLGGGISLANAASWIDAGAGHVIVTSCLFDDKGNFRERVLREIVASVGREHLVVDLSCRKTSAGWTVAMNRWQTLTTLEVTLPALDALAEYCDEFLIHAADAEGLCNGIDEDLVSLLGAWGGKRAVTYAGGIARLEDFDTIERLSDGNVDATVGSALDLFGGTGVRYADLLKREGRR